MVCSKLHASAYNCRCTDDSLVTREDCSGIKPERKHDQTHEASYPIISPRISGCHSAPFWHGSWPRAIRCGYAPPAESSSSRPMIACASSLALWSRVVRFVNTAMKIPSLGIIATIVLQPTWAPPCPTRMLRPAMRRLLPHRHRPRLRPHRPYRPLSRSPPPPRSRQRCHRRPLLRRPSRQRRLPPRSRRRPLPRPSRLPSSMD